MFQQTKALTSGGRLDSLPLFFDDSIMKTIFLLSACAFAPLTMPAHSAPAAPSAPALTTPKLFPAQATIAAKTMFGTVAASDKSVTGALNAKALADAQKLVGKPGAFQGTVTQVYSPKSHGFVALDFAASYRDALTADIAPEDYAKFPDLGQLVGKRVVVSGKFVAHGSSVQLTVTRPDQIKIVP